MWARNINGGSSGNEYVLRGYPRDCAFKLSFLGKRFCCVRAFVNPFDALWGLRF